MCGDVVTFDARIGQAGQVTDVATDLKGCILVQASASLLAQTAVGHSAREISLAREAVAAMLNGGADVEGAWAGYEIFKPAMAYKSRHSCVLLPIEALETALKDCTPS